MGKNNDFNYEKILKLLQDKKKNDINKIIESNK